MIFAPAGDIIGAAHQVRSVGIKECPDLPDGEYSFVDMYCMDPECDCRKTMIQVMHGGKVVATINYGWEPEKFYRKWMGGKKDSAMPRMHGASIDMTSPNRVKPEAILSLFNALLDDMWISRFKGHYAAVKTALKKGNGPHSGNPTALIP